MSVDSPANYVTAMNPHYRDGLEISLEEYKTVENTLNSHVDAWFRMLGGDDRLEISRPVITRYPLCMAYAKTINLLTMSSKVPQ